MGTVDTVPNSAYPQRRLDELLMMLLLRIGVVGLMTSLGAEARRSESDNGGATLTSDFSAIDGSLVGGRQCKMTTSLLVTCCRKTCFGGSSLCTSRREDPFFF